jgi:glycosyltransferase involved in cell wall biosynthesis
VAPDDRWDDLLAADVVCLPTDYRAEIMPLTLIDALACGAAVVSTRWRGIGPTLDPCPAAVLVDRPDVGLVADAIADVAGRDRAEVRSQARAFFVANLSAERFAQRLASDIGARRD